MLESRKTRRMPKEGLAARLARWFEGGSHPMAGRAVEGDDTLVPELARDGGELARETKGAIFVEYVALLLLVTVGGAAAVVSLGAPLVALARFTQLWIGLPVP